MFYSGMTYKFLILFARNRHKKRFNFVDSCKKSAFFLRKTLPKHRFWEHNNSKEREKEKEQRKMMIFNETKKYLLFKMQSTCPVALYADYKRRGLEHLAKAVLELCKKLT